MPLRRLRRPAVGADGRASAVGATGGPGAQHLPPRPHPDQPTYAHAGRVRVAVGLHAGRGLRGGLPGAAAVRRAARGDGRLDVAVRRSEEHTSELQSLMRISYAVFCLKKKKCSTYMTEP